MSINTDSENYKFSQNTKCEFFPCHKIKNNDEFNCLFCFCPLYMLKEECGGNYKYSSGTKDCSDCIKPHAKGAYEHEMSKMNMVIKIGSDKS